MPVAFVHFIKKIIVYHIVYQFCVHPLKFLFNICICCIALWIASIYKYKTHYDEFIPINSINTHGKFPTLEIHRMLQP